MLRYVLWLLLVSIPAWANASTEDSAYYDRVHLSATAKMEIPNDVVVATLYYELEGSNQATLADKVNQRISSAIRLAKQHPGVKIQTPGYNTHPIYKKNKIDGWRVRQSIRMESENTENLGLLLGQLQEKISLQNIGHKVSTSTQDTTREKLTIEAIAEFKRKASLIAMQFDRPGYRLVQITVDTGTRPPGFRTGSAMVMEARAVAPPSLEGGTQTITVTVSGSIELQRP